jgi:hypothetical protein
MKIDGFPDWRRLNEKRQRHVTSTAAENARPFGRGASGPVHENIGHQKIDQGGSGTGFSPR